MLCVEVQFQIEALFSDGLKHLELLDLWGYLKSRLYMNGPRTIEELKLAIRQEIAALPQKCWSMRCRTLRRGFECVSGMKYVI